VVAPGFKYNMPDINAAIGLAQLERAESMRQERQRCFEYYLKHLAGIEGLDLPVIRGSLEEHSCHLFWIVLARDWKTEDGRRKTEDSGRKSGLAGNEIMAKRNALIEQLAEAGIGTSVHYKPLHRMTYYRERYGLKPEDFPNAERHWQGCLSLPVYPSLTNAELEYIVRSVKEALTDTKVR
jgi:dTDP-4-amino-4,6-dideoxygalactose transaminase